MARIDKSGKETKIADAVETKPAKKIMFANLKDKIVDKSYISKINNPVSGCKYKLLWEIDLEKLSNYLVWMESRM